MDVKEYQIIKPLFSVNTIENGGEEDRFCLFISFTVKLLMKTCSPIGLEWISGANVGEAYFILVTFLLGVHCSGCQHLVITQKALSIESSADSGNYHLKYLETDWFPKILENGLTGKRSLECLKRITKTDGSKY